MKKNITNIISILLFIIFILIFIYQKDVKDMIIFSTSLWKDSLLPSMFPYLLISNMLIEYDFTSILEKYFNNIFRKIFNIPASSIYAIITSMFSGFPSGSKYVSDLLRYEKISLIDANYLIMFTHFPNPLFVISFIGDTLLKNINLGYVILISIILSNFIISFIFRPKKKVKEIKENTKKTNKNFANILTKSSINSFGILINMLGIIMFFGGIITVICKVFNPSLFIKVIISSLLEMTNGLNFLTKCNINIILKCSIISSVISFSGFSVHMQVKSIIADTSIKYKYFLLSRIIGSILSFFITYVILISCPYSI